MFRWPFEAGVQVRPNWWRRGGPRSVGFASDRGEGRLHAACDLMAPRGTPIRAITDGTVLDYSTFYEGTWELVVRHESEGMQPFLVRYGEVLGPEDGIRQTAGAEVAAGELIARVGRLERGGSMLHLELYSTSNWPFPSLSIPERLKKPPQAYSDAERANVVASGWHWNFQRRLDMADPTDFLLALRDGQTPRQPIPYDSSLRPEGELDAMLVTPSDEFLRDQGWLRARRAHARSMEEYRRWLEREGRLIGAGGRFHTPGPLGLTRADVPRDRCELLHYEERHGPD